EAHGKDPACATCHGLMDPVGLTLEHYDAIGRYRATEGTLTIDTSGEMDGKTFDGMTGLAQALRSHPNLTTCLPRQLFRYFSGRFETDTEEAAVRSLATQFAAGGDVKGLIAEVVTSDMFRLAAASN